MVKVSFNTALAQKEVKKDSETLIPEKDPEAAQVRGQPSRAWCWCFYLGLALMLSGVVVGGAYLFRYYVREGSSQFSSEGSGDVSSQQEGQVYFCGFNYREEDYKVQEEEDIAILSIPLRRIDEVVQVLQDEEVELIDVPVPDFGDSDPAEIVHDFRLNQTAYLDKSLDKCYVIPLNTSVVMPPHNFVDLLIKMEKGTYLPQTYLVREQMMVTEKLDDLKPFGKYINKLCHDKETFSLVRRDTILGLQKREALDCRKILHFESEFAVETTICEL